MPNTYNKNNNNDNSSMAEKNINRNSDDERETDDQKESEMNETLQFVMKCRHKWMKAGGKGGSGWEGGLFAMCSSPDDKLAVERQSKVIGRWVMVEEEWVVARRTTWKESAETNFIRSAPRRHDNWVLLLLISRIASDARGLIINRIYWRHKAQINHRQMWQCCAI